MRETCSQYILMYFLLFYCRQVTVGLRLRGEVSTASSQDKHS
jgi:hypothetical protein